MQAAIIPKTGMANNTACQSVLEANSTVAIANGTPYNAGKTNFQKSVNCVEAFCLTTLKYA